jgi:hypothetical protein
MRTRASEHRAHTGSRRGRAPKRTLALSTGLLLIVGAVGWSTVQLLDEPSTAGRSPETHLPVRVAASDATPSREMDIPSFMPEGVEPLLGTASASKRSAGTTGAVPPSTHELRTSAATVAAGEQPAEATTASAGDRETTRALMSRMGAASDDDTRLDVALEVLTAHGTNQAHDQLLDMSLHVLAELEPDSLAPTLHDLVRATEEGSEGEATVAYALGRVARDNGVLGSEELVSFYEAGSRQVQLAAASALTRRGDDSLSLSHRERCVDELDHADGEVRAVAVRDLAAQGDPALVELVAPLLVDADRNVRLQSVRALERSEDPAVRDRVGLLVDDAAPDVSSAAQRALRRMDLRLASAR